MSKKIDLVHKNVIVTGADGFIGSHLVEALVNKGANVTALSQYNSFNTWGWLDVLPKSTLDRIKVVTGDIRDPSLALKLLEKADICFHLAALIAIPFSYDCPDSYVQTNITGTLNFLNAARQHKTPHLLVTSTSEVYGTATYVPIDEKHPRQPQSPYSATKIAADALADSYYRSFSLPVTIVRPFNTYGPRQSARAVIPTIITQALAGKEIKLGSLTPTRDLVYVKDTAEGFIRIAESRDDVLGEEINIATSNEISIGSLLNMIKTVCGVSMDSVADNQRFRPAASEVERLLGCNKKIKSLTNWVPGTDLKQGLVETVSWFKNPENLKKYRADIYNV
jgi:NAD dependent epimerase/dehydratase